MAFDDNTLKFTDTVRDFARIRMKRNIALAARTIAKASVTNSGMRSRRDRACRNGIALLFRLFVVTSGFSARRGGGLSRPELIMVFAFGVEADGAEVAAIASSRNSGY